MTRGGHRKGSGRKPKYPRHGLTKAIRIPEELAAEVETAIREQKLFIQRETIEQLSTEINMFLLNWERKSDEEKRQRLREISKALGKLLGE